jgi:transposase
VSVAENEMTVVRLKNGGRREFRSKEERRRIVEETLKAGASVALVARANGVNANQVFKWRAQYRKGRLEVKSPTTTLVPVEVSDAIRAIQPVIRRKSKARKSGIIDIDLGHARIRIEGTADPECVRAALEGLAR